MKNLSRFIISESRHPISADIPVVDFDRAAAYDVWFFGSTLAGSFACGFGRGDRIWFLLHISFDHSDRGAFHTFHDAHMIRPAPVVADAGVAPAIKDNISQLWSVGIVFLPFTQLLEETDHFTAAAFSGNDVRHFALDRDC